MKKTLLTAAIALALGTLAACDRNSNPTPRSTSATPAQAAPAGTGSSNTPSTPANIGAPSQADKSPGAQPPVQGREDVRQPEQRRDFEQKGDGAGPKPGG
jgi:hypothetical protein